MSGIKASVGIHNGKQCYNVVSDQETVQRLLNDLPKSEGGAGGTLADPIRWGIVSSSLHQAIIAFQRWHHLSVDGHIDPNGAAIKLLEKLTGGPAPGETAPAGDGESTFTNKRTCGPMRVVRSGFLPATITLRGRPNGRIDFTNVSTASDVEIDLRSPPWAAEKKTTTLVPGRVDPKSFDLGMPPPLPWDLSLTSVGTSVGAIRFSFSTDWEPGDPPCDPP